MTETEIARAAAIAAAAEAAAEAAVAEAEEKRLAGVAQIRKSTGQLKAEEMAKVVIGVALPSREVIRSSGRP